MIIIGIIIVIIKLCIACSFWILAAATHCQDPFPRPISPRLRFVRGSHRHNPCPVIAVNAVIAVIIHLLTAQIHRCFNSPERISKVMS